MRRPSPEQAARRRILALALFVGVLATVAWALGRDDGSPTATVTRPADPSTTASMPGDPLESPSTTVASTGRFTASEVTGPVVGEGPLRTYSVEVEEGTGIDPDRFADQVEAILSDRRGWTEVDTISLQRVSGPADIEVVLATPDTVDLLCFPLQTGGELSCAQSPKAIVNLERWRSGAPPARLGLEDYRAYVVSHEVGHTLGHGHVDCPAKDAPAPVMMQQTLSIGECSPNAWPVPPGAIPG